jgi:hypothetical protein
VERAHCDFTPQKSTFDHQIERRKTMKNTPMTPEERVEAFKRELGLMLGQSWALTQKRRSNCLKTRKRPRTQKRTKKPYNRSTWGVPWENRNF